MKNLNEFQNTFLQKHITLRKFLNKKKLRLFISSLEVNVLELNYKEIEDILFEKRNRDLSSLLLTGVFNSMKYAKHFKNSSVYKKYLSQLTMLNFEEKDIFLASLDLELTSVDNAFKSKYKEKEAELSRIISVDEVGQLHPKARKLIRVIKANLGPTNSGKTYNAIVSLKGAQRGIYLAPLRLLAREVYDDLKKAGIKTSLITGEEKIIDPEATHVCSTVEMADLNKEYDVAVIDEIQFMGDSQRGNAWTRALLGLAAKDIIVMGSTDSFFLINKIAEKTGDIVDVEFFSRLSPLNMTDDNIKIEELKSGDAIITFSRISVHKIVRILEEDYKLKVSMIYGALPPEVRLEEARRFNNEETDVLVSTDAIGYGLNLNIQRVIFSTVGKFNGESIEILEESSFKQISGRAGRFQKTDDGEVAFSSEFNKRLKRPETYKEYLKLNKTFNHELSSLEDAYYFPEWEVIESVALQLENEDSLRDILTVYFQRFKDDVLKFDFMFLDQMLTFLDNKDLLLVDKYKLVFAPVRDNSEEYFRKCVDHILDDEPCFSFFSLHLEKARSLENLEEISHNALLYMWLSQRYPLIFKEYDKAKDVYDEISYLIIDMLKKGY